MQWLIIIYILIVLKCGQEIIESQWPKADLKIWPVSQNVVNIEPSNNDYYCSVYWKKRNPLLLCWTNVESWTKKDSQYYWLMKANEEKPEWCGLMMDRLDQPANQWIWKWNQRLNNNGQYYWLLMKAKLDNAFISIDQILI